MQKSEDLSNFLRREKVSPIKGPDLKEQIEHIHEMDSYLSSFESPKFLVNQNSKRKVKVMNRLQATKLIEENIDYLTANRKLLYKIGHI